MGPGRLALHPGERSRAICRRFAAGISRSATRRRCGAHTGLKRFLNLTGASGRPEYDANGLVAPVGERSAAGRWASNTEVTMSVSTVAVRGGMFETEVIE